MIKIKTGSMFGSPGTNVCDHEVVIPVSSPFGLKDALIGGGMVLMGIAYLTYTAYMNGAKAFERAELHTMREADIINWDPEDVLNGDRWKWSVK
jgi:hypothetical protein